MKVEMSHLKDELVQRLEKMPEAVAQHMREQFTIEGAVQVTRTDVQLLMAEMEARVFAAFGSMANNVQAKVSAATNVAQNPSNFSGYASFTWGGRIHNVPQDFVFPR